MKLTLLIQCWNALIRIVQFISFKFNSRTVIFMLNTSKTITKLYWTWWHVTLSHSFSVFGVEKRTHCSFILWHLSSGFHNTGSSQRSAYYYRTQRVFSEFQLSRQSRNGSFGWHRGKIAGSTFGEPGVLLTSLDVHTESCAAHNRTLAAQYREQPYHRVLWYTSCIT